MPAVEDGIVSIADHMVYGLLWLSFGAVHSLLAGETAKSRLRPWLGAGYRLAYNGFASVHVALIWLGGRALVGGDARTAAASAAVRPPPHRPR